MMSTKLYSISIIVTLICIFSDSLFAQRATVTWSLTGSAENATPTISGSVAGSAQLINYMGINGYSGATFSQNTSQRLYSSGSGTGYWPAETDQNPVRFAEYKMAPATNTNMVIDTIFMELGDNIGNQSMQVNIYYFVGTDTVDFLAKAIKLNSSTQYCRVSNISQVPIYPLSVSVPYGNTLYMRVYPWYTTGAVSGKYFMLCNVCVIGTTTAIPVYTTATWPLLTDGNAIVSGLVMGSTIKFDGTNLYHYGYNATNGDRWTNNLPSKGAWPGETSPNFTRFAQFSVSPQIGPTFYADTIRFTQIAESTTTLRVALYHSKDSTFATKTFIADTIVPVTQTSYEYVIPTDTLETGRTFYLRFYPYNTNTDDAWKFLNVSDVIISGATKGMAILAPTVTTTSASYISNTFLTTGGNATADGGGYITAKGVCWNTTGSPNLSNSYTTDGAGIGSFVSLLTGLSPGTKYYIRAYATNIGGTGYGNEISVTTLSAIVPPSVTTTAVSSIMSATAVSGGNVIEWGGDSVTSRGVCWNTDTTISYPTTTESRTIDGSGIGSFVSGLTGLIGSTKYFVRAYATNSAGTSYGNLVTFTTQKKASDTTVVVAQNGSGNYMTLQAAFNAVPVNYTGKWTIFVKKGKYHEKDTLAAGKVNVILIGEERDSTVIWNADFSDMNGSGKPGTNGTFTITIDANDFIAKNITFVNTYWPNRYGTVSGTQGVAVSANGDRQQFINCVFDGYQDTYYTRGSNATGRAYHKNCIIRGTVDYIFGRNICVFDSCTIISMKNGGSITAASTEASSLYGYVFRNCTLLTDTSSYTDSTGFIHSALTSFYLGRPWQNNPRTVYLNCYEPAALLTVGWTTMQTNPTLYAEYNCYGPGFTTTRGTVSGWPSANQARQLTSVEAATYTLSTIFSKKSASSSLILYDWMPSYANSEDDMPFIVTSVEDDIVTVSIPKELTLCNNFPNPFNSSTQIQFSVPKDGRIILKVYNLIGQEVATLFDGMANTGQFITKKFSGNGLASGVYFARLQFNGNFLVKRMLLLK
jgi:pectin methylesterase-like acyl-CoA thioesterase